MTVADLKTLLDSMPQDAPVIIEGYTNGTEDDNCQLSINLIETMVSSRGVEVIIWASITK